MATFAVSYLDGDGRELESETFAGAAWTAFKPDTVGAAILQAACGGRSGATTAPSRASEPNPEAFTSLLKDEEADWKLWNESVSFTGARFVAVIFQEYAKERVDQASKKVLSGVGWRVEGDCAVSTLKVGAKRAFDTQSEVVREIELTDVEAQARRYSDNTIAFAVLTAVCRLKGFQVAAARADTDPSSSSADKPRSGSSGPSGRTTGSAFAVSPNGHLLTNNHVVKECDRLFVSAPQVAPTPARVMARDGRNDLALIQSQLATPVYASFRVIPMRAGEPIVALGFPLKGLLANEVNVSTGTVSALAGITNDTSKLQISAPIQPGNSGGPLLDSTASVSAIVVEKLDALAVVKATGTIPEGIGFGVKSELALLFLRSAGIEPRMAAAGLPRLDAAEIAQRGRPMTFLLECEPAK